MKATLIEAMGTDLTVVNAARVSFAKESDWDTTPTGIELQERDRKLLNYLAKHNHWTPFAHPQVQLHLKMPIFVARQIDKHQVGFVVNEISRRYVDYEPEFYEPKVWRKKAENVKQGSDWAGVDDGLKAHRRVSALVDVASITYEQLLDQGVCPEQARMVLPQSMYTEQHKTGSLYAWFNLCKLRTSPDAQRETQELALQIENIMVKLFPESWSALNGRT